MTRAKMQTDGPFTTWIVVNGRKARIAKRITEIQQAPGSKGRWVGLADGKRFEIEGGRHAGGTSRDWFVQWDAISERCMKATSFVDAVTMIETA
jgi:hypothetical protein